MPLAATAEAGYVVTAVIPDDEVDAGNVALTSGETAFGTLDYGEFDTFTIHANAGDTLTCMFLDDSPNAAFSGTVDLYTPNGTFAGRGAGQNGFQFGIVAPLTGPYTFIVFDGNSDATANYELTATRLP